MVTLHLEPSQASVEHVRSALNLQAGEIDAEFGLLCLDSARKLYAIRVAESVADRIEGTPDVSVFSDPRIEPFRGPD